MFLPMGITGETLMSNSQSNANETVNSARGVKVPSNMVNGIEVIKQQIIKI